MTDMSLNDIYFDIREHSREIVRLCGEKGLKIATAESCTGGMISAAITAVSGSSAVIEMGVCSYSNRIKQEVLGVSRQTLDSFTEYSIQCAEEMARGVMTAADADFGVSTTGVAGPAGGTEQHPVGEVCIGISTRNSSYAARFVFSGESDDISAGRDVIRAKATHKALKMLLDSIKQQ